MPETKKIIEPTYGPGFVAIRSLPVQPPQPTKPFTSRSWVAGRRSGQEMPKRPGRKSPGRRAGGTKPCRRHIRTNSAFSQYRRTRTGFDQFPLIPMLHVQCSPICDTYRMYGCRLCPRFGYALAEDRIYLLHRDPHSCTAHRRSSLYLQQTTNKYQQSQIDQGCSPKKKWGDA